MTSGKNTGDETLFQCNHCGEKMDLETLFDAMAISGCIFLFGKIDGYFGIVCPNQQCLKTTIDKRDIDSLTSLKNTLFGEAGYVDGIKTPRIMYYSFPYSLPETEALPESISFIVNELGSDFGALDKSEVIDPTIEEDSTFLGYCSYDFGDLAMGPAIGICWLREEDIHEALTIENETGLKVFPRYMIYDPIYTAIDYFCWRNHLQLDYIEMLNLDLAVVQVGESLPKKAIRNNFEFLNILDTISYKDLKLLSGSAMLALPSAISGIPVQTEISLWPKEESDQKGKAKRLIARERMSEKVWANFNKNYVQELLSTMSFGFISKYLSLSRRSDRTYEQVWDLKESYLRDLYDAVRSRTKRIGAKQLASKTEQGIVQKMEKEFPELGRIISCDHAINKIKINLTQLSRSPHIITTYLLLGESGTGKELFAKAIDGICRKAGRTGRLVPANCGAISEKLFESEMFGHVRGSFPGAADHKGRFERANRGTICLDEIGNLSRDHQAKLLRVLSEGEIQPVGGKVRKVDVMTILATNKDLDRMVENNEFRFDLYQRIKIPQFHIPPLRKRKQDLPMLVRHFVDKFNSAVKENPSLSRIDISEGFLDALMEYDWPGNVRELEMVLKEILAYRYANGDRTDITTSDLPDYFTKGSDDESIATGEIPPEITDRNEQIVYLMNKYNNKSEVARRLKIDKRTVFRRIKEHNLWPLKE